MKKIIFQIVIVMTWCFAGNTVAQQTKIRNPAVEKLSGKRINNAIEKFPPLERIFNLKSVLNRNRNWREVQQREPNKAKADLQSDTTKIQIKNPNKIHLGYGETRSQKELTAAIGIVRADELSKSSVLNPMNALYGRIPGLTVLENPGRPPTAATMFTRGRGTFGNSNMLILVDGIERPPTSFSINEIKSITVLKDAAALALYGQRGANGVMLVNTKRGGKDVGLFNVNASFEQAITQPKGLPKFLEAKDYARALNEALNNDGKAPRYDNDDIEAFDLGKFPSLYPNVSWFDEVLRDYGTRTNFDINFEGGGDNVRYFALVNYMKDEGIFGPVNRNEAYSTQWKYNRFNFRSNLDVDLTKDLLFRLNAAGNIKLLNVAGGGDQSIFNGLYSIPSAAFPVKTPDGSWGGTRIYGNNPMAILTSTGYRSPFLRELYIDGKLRQKLDMLIKGLSAEAKVGYSNQASYTDRKTKNYSYESVTPVKNEAGDIVNTAVTKYGDNTELNFGSGLGLWGSQSDIFGKLKYEQSFDNNEVEAMALFHQQGHTTRGKDNTIRRRNFAANIHYGLAGKYYIDLTASYSGNNLLPKENRYAFFPALSFAWLLSKENFLQDISFLDRLKLRASWGMSGNDLLPSNNPYLQTYGRGGSFRFGTGNDRDVGIREGRLAALNFGVEKSYKTNVGLEVGLFEKLNFTTDVYYARRKNILTGTNGEISNVLGIAPPLSTDGIVENKGFEAALDWNDAMGNFSYHIGGQFSFSHNEIISMNEQFRPYSYLRRTGESIGQRFGLQVIGFFEGEEDISNSPKQVFSKVKPGDIKYKDQNGDGIINEFDEIPIGYNSQYPEIYFSASLDFNYKGIGISALLQGTGHYTAYLNTQNVYWPLRNNNTISTYYYNHRWTPATSDIATLPRLTTGNNANNFRPNSLWLVDRSYIKLRMVEVHYFLPVSIIKRWKMRNFKIYIRGMNLLSFDHIDMLDSEFLSAGYPLLRTYNIGLQLGF